MSERLSINGRELEVVTLNTSDIDFECAKWRVKSTQKIGALISFLGHYREGSAGTGDAMWILWRTKELIDLTRPDGLVVSFEHLDYEYGDDLDLPWSILDGPFQIVCSSSNRDAICGIFGEDDVCDSLEAAVLSVSQKLEK